jgi:RimJ/RimL family protein N-acetyltransferase
MDAGQVSFRRLEERDLPLMHAWLNTPHVSKWYAISKRNPSYENVRDKYLPRIMGQSPTTCYAILYGNAPVGMVQSCKLDDYPSVIADYDLEGKVAGIDIFIGEEGYVYRGLGSNIMGKFLKETVFVRYDVDSCIVDPNPENTSAIRAYEKAGFRYVKTVWYRADSVWAYLMMIRRQDLE